MSISIQDSVEANSLVTCGYCGKKNLSKLLTEPGTSYVKKCVICKEDSFNHKRCTSIFAGQLSTKDAAKSYNIGIENFGLCKIPYYCQKCMQKECFTCNKKHSQRKLNNLLYSKFNYIVFVLITFNLYRKTRSYTCMF